MNEDWKENMAYAPLIVAEVDTDYQKVEDFIERDLKTAEKERSLPFSIEDYFGGNEVSEDNALLGEEEDAIDEIEEEYSMVKIVFGATEGDFALSDIQIFYTENENAGNDDNNDDDNNDDNNNDDNNNDDWTGDFGHPSDPNQSNNSPVGEAWVLLLFAAVAAIVVYCKQGKKEILSQKL